MSKMHADLPQYESRDELIAEAEFVAATTQDADLPVARVIDDLIAELEATTKALEKP